MKQSGTAAHVAAILLYRARGPARPDQELEFDGTRLDGPTLPMLSPPATELATPVDRRRFRVNFYVDGTEEQAPSFHEFLVERHVPADHLLRSIDRFVSSRRLLGLPTAEERRFKECVVCTNESASRLSPRVPSGGRGARESPVLPR